MVNLFGDDWEHDRERPGWQWRRLAVGERLGARAIGASLYEVAPGQRTFPYHYEYGNEEWLITISGRPTLRTPGGEHELSPGDVAVFPEGPDGAHQIINRTEEPVRVLILSTKNRPGVAVYPDSDKVGVFPGTDDPALFQRGSAVDYFEGED